MDYFCFVEWESFQEEEVIPKIPDDIPFVLIAGDPGFSKWAILECDFPEDYEFFDEEISPVPEELEILLYSAKSYPPAIALAREDLSVSCKKLTNLSLELLSEMYAGILKRQLELQKHRLFFLAESNIDEDDFLIKGAFYWIIGFNIYTNEVDWVADDYSIFQNPAEDFGLDPIHLRNYFIQ